MNSTTNTVAKGLLYYSLLLVTNKGLSYLFIVTTQQDAFTHNKDNVSDVRQIEVHTVEPLVLGPGRLEVVIAIAKLKSINCQVVMKFKQEAKYYCLRSTNSLILFGIWKNCLISGRSVLLYKFTKRVTKLTTIIIVGHHCYQLHTKFYQISSSQG
jgi:hypothetical protein